jgi:hypothetical protein
MVERTGIMIEAEARVILGFSGRGGFGEIVHNSHS